MKTHRSFRSVLGGMLSLALGLSVASVAVVNTISPDGGGLQMQLK